MYISTDSPEDLRRHSTELVSFQKAEEYEYRVAAITTLLEFPNHWFVGSKSGCSCTFRHLHPSAVGLGLSSPEDWYEEEQVNLGATKQLYDVIMQTLSSGYRVDCIDMWAGAERLCPSRLMRWLGMRFASSRITDLCLKGPLKHPMEAARLRRVAQLEPFV